MFAQGCLIGLMLRPTLQSAISCTWRSCDAIFSTARQIFFASDGPLLGFFCVDKTRQLTFWLSHYDGASSLYTTAIWLCRPICCCWTFSSVEMSVIWTIANHSYRTAQPADFSTLNLVVSKPANAMQSLSNSNKNRPDRRLNGLWYRNMFHSIR